MTVVPHCPDCGAALLDESGCPHCLLRLGLSEPPDAGDADFASTAREAVAPDLPASIGPYRLLGKLGEGGMGVVYLAEQEAPIRRRVALKLIKLGMDTRQVIARFESERQALALMHHPHVAAVYDAGATPEGRPYFVMEYVPGVPITEYCDERRLEIPGRLALFGQACDAIQHAHQKGIIHRDIKPTNVLVTALDGPPIVKVIDFGVAKAVSDPLTGRTRLTHHGALIGTPAYMSPEQADARHADVDTRTDVYSLGVLLYELLAGALPYDSAELRKAGHDEIRRWIREEDPPRPSTRVSTLGEASVEAARKRRTTSKTLQSELRGDLDWIVMRALDKDPGRRYPSPSELAADLLRYRHHEPVTARAPSAVYRVRKLVRRHRLAVAAAVLIALSIGAGAAVAAWQAVRASRAERLAIGEARAAQEVAGFLAGLFEGADPEVARGNPITARELLERGRQRIERELGDQPDVRARLLTLLGDIHRKLGLYREAAPLLEAALTTRERLHGPEHPDVAETVFALARLTADRGDHAEAAPLFRRAREIVEQTSADRALLGSIIGEQAELARRASAFDRAEALYRESLALREAAFGPSHPDVASTHNGLGNVYYERGELAKAEEAFRRALAIRRETLGDDHPDVAATLSHLAPTLGRLGRDAEAEPLMEEAVRIQEKVFGPDHFRVASALNNLAGLYGRQGRLREARAVFERVVAIREQLFGDSHPDVAMGYRNLALVHSLSGEYVRANDYIRRALAIDEHATGPTHLSVVWDLNTLGGVERRRGNLTEAARVYSLARERAEQGVGTTHPEYVRALEGLGGVALDRSALDDAERCYREALEVQEATLGPAHFGLAGPLDGLGAVALAQGRPRDAIERHRRALELRASAQGETHPGLAATLRGLAGAYRAAGNLAGARSALLRAIRVTETAYGPEHPEVAAGAHALGELLLERGDADAAREQFARALAIRKKTLGDAHPETQASARAAAR